MAGGNLSYVAGGNIAPSRFVTASSGANSVVQADAGAGSAGDIVMGISGQWQRNLPWTPTQDGYCAIAGENVRVYTEEEVCYLEIADTIAFGGRIKSNVDGKGIPVSADGDNIGAVAQESGIAGQLIKVQVRIGQRAS
jgi:hypothetical protein